jgi:hypothetical protein
VSVQDNCNCYWQPPHLCPVHCDDNNEIKNLRAELNQLKEERENILQHLGIPDHHIFCNGGFTHTNRGLKYAGCSCGVIKWEAKLKEERDKARRQRDWLLPFADSCGCMQCEASILYGTQEECNHMKAVNKIKAEIANEKEI